MNKGDLVYITCITPYGIGVECWTVFADYQDGTFMAKNIHEDKPRIFKLGDIRRYVPNDNCNIRR